MSRYGISQTLDRVFTAPNLVKKVMCDESRIQDAYIGDRSTQVGVGCGFWSGLVDMGPGAASCL